MRRWIFLRHGESVANAEGWLSGQVDTPLTERGRDQARQAARDLAGAKESFRVWLAHDPRVGGWLEPGSCDLLLSGHSHGGQVGLNMFGLRPTLWGLLGHRDQGWWEAGGAPHYVHAGNWWIGLPPRMGVSGEIAVFEPGEAER